MTSRTGDSITLGSLNVGDTASAVRGASVSADVLGNAIIFALSPARCYRIEVANSLGLIDFFEECTRKYELSVSLFYPIAKKVFVCLYMLISNQGLVSQTVASLK